MLSRILNFFRAGRPLLNAFLLIVFVRVAVLAHPTRVQFVMWTFPWFLGSAFSVIAVIAHSLRVVGKLIVATNIVDLCNLFSMDAVGVRPLLLFLLTFDSTFHLSTLHHACILIDKQCSLFGYLFL